MRKSKNRYFYHIFVSTGGRPWANHAKCCMDGKRNSMLTNYLAACAHLTITVSEIQRDICEKIVILSYPLAFDASVSGVSVGISAPPLGWKNWNGVATRWWKNFEDMFIRFDVIHERDRQTDGQTDTGWQQRPRFCIASRGKNGVFFETQCKSWRTGGAHWCQ